MTEWPKVKLGELVSIKHGYAFKGEYFRDAPPGDVLLTPGNFAIGGGFQLRKVKYYDGPAVAGFVLSPGDLLVTMTDLSKAGDTLGYPAIVPADRRYLHNQRLGKVLIVDANVSQGFIYWLMRTKPYRDEVLSGVTGSTVKHTSPKKIEAFEFQLPSRPEQDAICEVLFALDDKIELNRRMNETLEAMAQAIFRDWFVDFGPVRRKMAGATDPVEVMGGVTSDRLQATELIGLFPSALTDEELPTGFEYVTLRDAVSALETGTRPKGGIKGIDHGIPSIGAESIIGLAQFDFSKTKYVPQEFFNSMRRGVLGERDVLLYKDGGRPGEFEPHVAMFGAGFPFPQCCINEHVYRVVAADPFSQEFLYLHLTSEGSMDEMRNKGTGVAIPGLNSTAANSLSILNPGPKLLEAFTLLTRPLLDAALHGAKQSRTLAETRDYLLPRLMSGEVRVGDATREIAA